MEPWQKFISITLHVIDYLTNLLYQDKDCIDYIAWDTDGKMFHIPDPTEFSAKVLPRYCKHNNYSSFVRLVSEFLSNFSDNIEI